MCGVFVRGTVQYALKCSAFSSFYNIEHLEGMCVNVFCILNERECNTEIKILIRNSEMNAIKSTLHLWYAYIECSAHSHDIIATPRFDKYIYIYLHRRE